jgi:hypothetical protein
MPSVSLPPTTKYDDTPDDSHNVQHHTSRQLTTREGTYPLCMTSIPLVVQRVGNREKRINEQVNELIVRSILGGRLRIGQENF